MLKVHYGSTDRELSPYSWFVDVCDRSVMLTEFSRRMIKEVSGFDVG